MNGHSIERVPEYKSLKFHSDTKKWDIWTETAYFPLFSGKWIIEAVFSSTLDYGDVICSHIFCKKKKTKKMTG